jgi:hypothetical protein
VQRLIKEAETRGVSVFIIGAGAAAHLAGVVAAHVTKPVIGVPIDSSALNGLDALLSTVQMPPGVPVATSVDRQSGSHQRGCAGGANGWRSSTTALRIEWAVQARACRQGGEGRKNAQSES